jgi:hypothetical protein
MDLEVPQQSGEVVCLPPPRTFLALAAQNAARLDAADADLAGVGVRELRSRMRARVTSQAAAYVARLGLALPGGWPGTGPLIGTGHQPFLFHPGIWTKHLLIARLGAHCAALSMAVDCDTAEDIGVDVPTLAGGLRIARETLFRAEPDVPYEALAAPSVPAWRGFLDRIDAGLKTLPHHGVHEIFSTFASQTADLTAPDLGAFLTLARRAHEGPRRYAELPVSRLTRMPEFRLFVTHILRQAARFADVYNRHLDDYRRRYNVRTAAQPFPNLSRDGGRIELPFWIIREGRRRPLFAEHGADRVTVFAGPEAVTVVPVRGEPGGLEEIEIRPKALALTAFKRICVVDLFVHGVGGARYDRVTDAVVREFFHLEPPAYAVATSTLHLPLSEFDPSDERALLQRRLLAVRHNPERALSARDREQQRLIEEKWALIRRLDDPALGRSERRAATRRIREINEQLAGGLTAERVSIEQRLAELAEIGEASAAATHRGYPFCFFPPSAVDALVDRVWNDGRSA